MHGLQIKNRNGINELLEVYKMRYCKKCGKELKENDQLCAYCDTAADTDHNTGQMLKKTDSTSELSVDEKNTKKSGKILTWILIAGIIILALIIILIILYIWHGFMDASNFISFSQIQPPTS